MLSCAVDVGGVQKGLQLYFDTTPAGYGLYSGIANAFGAWSNGRIIPRYLRCLQILCGLTKLCLYELSLRISHL